MLRFVSYSVLLILCIHYKFSFSQPALKQDRILSSNELRQDLLFLKNKLETLHPNLYLYSSKTELDELYDSLSNSIVLPMTDLEFYKHIAVLSSTIKDGHTNFLPGKETMSYHDSFSKFLPYKLIVYENKLYVDRVLTYENSVLRGSEIISINNISSKEIISELKKRLVRDGNNQTYPSWILSNYFRNYYSFSYGHPTDFKIEYLQRDATGTVMIKALSKDSISYYNICNYQEIENTLRAEKGIKLQISNDSIYAVLKIRDFHKSVLKHIYKQNFKKEIRKAFYEIEKNKTPYLILDLRDNQGGELTYGKLLVSHLIDKPFSLIESYYKVNSSGGKYELKKTGGKFTGQLRPSKETYQGNLIVLINGGSFSNSGIVASCLKRNTKTTFVGEETGGNDKVLAGYIKEIILPFSQIEVQIPTKQFMLDNDLPLTGRGTIPDLPFQQNNSMDTSDAALNYVINKIIKGK